MNPKTQLNYFLALAETFLDTILPLLDLAETFLDLAFLGLGENQVEAACAWQKETLGQHLAQQRRGSCGSLADRMPLPRTYIPGDLWGCQWQARKSRNPNFAKKACICNRSLQV